MRQILIILTVLGAFLLEWGIHAVLAGQMIFVPVVAVVFLMWSWHMKFEARLWFALAVGFIMDAVYPVVFGSSLLACVFLAFLCEAFMTFFSNTEARITQSIGIVSLLLFFLGAVPLFDFMLGKFI